MLQGFGAFIMLEDGRYKADTAETEETSDKFACLFSMQLINQFNISSDSDCYVKPTIKVVKKMY